MQGLLHMLLPLPLLGVGQLALLQLSQHRLQRCQLGQQLLIGLHNAPQEMHAHVHIHTPNESQTEGAAHARLHKP